MNSSLPMNAPMGKNVADGNSSSKLESSSEELRIKDHRFQLELELRAIEAQYLKSRAREAGQLGGRLREAEGRLEEFEVKLLDHELVSKAELERLREAEYHLARLLARVERSPLRTMARQKSGYRRMVDRWL